MQVMFVFHGVIPTEKHPVNGNGLRAWALGSALSERGHRVIYSTKLLKMAYGAEIPEEMKPYCYYNSEELRRIIGEVKPDVLVVEQPEELCAVGGLGVPVVADLFAPRIVEIQFEKFDFEREMTLLVEGLRNADYFICAGRRQKYFHLALMMLAGVDVKEADVGVVPISTSPVLPERRKPAETTFVCGGVFWPWQDWVWSLRLLAEKVRSSNMGRVKVFGGQYPIEKEGPGFFNPFEGLPKDERVEFFGMVPYRDLLGHYGSASVGFDVMKANAERELSSSFRLVDYLACGLPVITGGYSETSDLVREYRAGWVVDPADTTAIEAAIGEALGSPEAIEKYGRNARRLAKERLTWDRTIGPLEEFCRSPRLRQKKATMLSSFVFSLFEKHEVVRERDDRIRFLEEQAEAAKAKIEEVTRLREAAYEDIRRLQRFGDDLNERLVKAQMDASLKRDEAAALLAEIRQVKHLHNLTLKDIEGFQSKHEMLKKQAEEQVASLQRECASTRADRDKAEMAAAQLRLERDEAVKDLKTIEVMAGDVRAEFKEKAAALDALVSSHASAAAEIANLTYQRDRLMKDLETADALVSSHASAAAEIANLTYQHDRLMKDLETANRIASEQRNDLQVLRDAARKFEAAKAEVETLKFQRDQMAKDVSTIEARAKELAAAISAHKSEADAKERIVRELSAAGVKANAEIENMRFQKGQFVKDIETVSAVAAALKGEIASMREYEAKYRAAAAEIENLRFQRDRMSKDLSSLDAAAQQQREETRSLKEARAQFEIVKAELEAVKAKSAAEREALQQSTRAEVENLAFQKEQAIKGIQAIEHRAEEMARELKALQAERLRSEAEKAQLETLRFQKEQGQRDIAMFEKMNNELRNEMEQIKLRNQQAMSDLHISDKHNEALRGEVEHLRRELENMKFQREQAVRDIKHFEENALAQRRRGEQLEAEKAEIIPRLNNAEAYLNAIRRTLAYRIYKFFFRG